MTISMSVDNEACLNTQSPAENSSLCGKTSGAGDDADVFIDVEMFLRCTQWMPHLFLWAVAPIYLMYFLSGGKTSGRADEFGRIKMSSTMFLVTASTLQVAKSGNLEVILASVSGENLPHVVRVVSLLLSTAVSKVENQRGSNHSYPLFVFWGLMVISDLVSVCSDLTSDLYLSDPMTFLVSASCLLGALIQLFLASMTDTEHLGADVHPEELCSFPGKLTLNWITRIVWSGYRTGLQEDDIPAMAEQDRCQTLCPAFEETWETEVSSLQARQSKTEKKAEDLKKGKESPERKTVKVNLLKVLVARYGAEYIAYQLIKLFFELTTFVEPTLMGYLLKHFQHRDTEPAWRGYALVLAIFASSLFIRFGHSRVWTSVDRLSKKMKTSLKMAVYKKALSARNEGKRDITTGEIVTLVADDCEKLLNGSNIVFFLFSTPIQVSVAFYMLYSQLGMGAFVGLAIMLALIPLNAWVGKLLRKFEKEKSDIKDERVKMMNEVLNGIKVLKLYAWEKSFMKKIMDIREKEVTVHKKMCIVHAGIDFMFGTIPFLVRVGGFMAFLTLGGYLDAPTAFTTSSLFEILNDPFSIMAIIIPEFVQASGALTKLNKFLNIEDMPEDVVVRKPDSESSITIKEGVFTWDRSSEKNCLEDINVNIPKGKLVAVVGMVGAGKSSLVSAMLGEMEKVEGDVNVSGTTAYVPQEAWILNISMKENVVFGSTFEDDKYEKVVDACELRSDMKLLSSGDKTLIGEKGINLSGGQKQRVSLARAVYADADIYLLDDPLSAVDSHVGKHIFDHVIGRRGLLQDKTRVMVTHGLHWLPYVDSILVLKDGKIQESGTYKELLDHDGAFAYFLREASKTTGEPNDPELTNMTKKLFVRLNSLTEYNKPYESDGSASEEEEESLDKFVPDSPSISIKEIDAKYEHMERKILSRLNSQEDPRNSFKCEWFPSEEFSISADDIYMSIKDKGPTDTTNDANADKKDSTEKAVEDEEEDTETGSVGMKVYWDYLKPVGIHYFIVCIVLFASRMFLAESKDLVMARWSDDTLLSNLSLADTAEYKDRAWGHLSAFAMYGGAEVLISFAFICLVLCRGCEAAKHHHNQLLVNILRSPMSFFDVTPTGRIINRFSKDIGSVDGLGGCLRGYICSLGWLVVKFSMMLYTTPGFIPYLIPFVCLFLGIQIIFIANLRQLRRYKTKSRSPIFVHLNETLNGTDSVRAYDVKKRFFKMMGDKLNNQMKFEMTEHWVWAWFLMRSTVLSSLVTLIAGLLLLWDTSVSPGMAGVILMYATHFVHTLSWAIRHSSHTETELISLERVVEYSNKPTEARWEIEDTQPPSKWPDSGDLVFNDYQARYRDGLDLVLKGVTCHIKSGENIGIVGRTGAGKSSLSVALFRLVEAAAGKICLDGQHIAPIGLHDLRKKLSILPQDPIIFGGSLKMNLDPFGEKSEEQLWEALRHSHLKSFVESLPTQLEHDCGEGGKNLSMGQRQLVCLARTLLRQSPVLVLDEATAGVDMETDELIQNTIRSEFRACTVPTIAHRLNTVMDYDRIMVLDKGQIKEFDSPKKLLADPLSVFYSMAKDANLV